MKAARTGYERHGYMIAQMFDEYKKLVRLYWNVSSFLAHYLVVPSRREYRMLRTYTKVENGVSTERTAYEVSIMRPALLEEFLF